MAKQPKMVLCKNCNTPIFEKAKVCPYCGVENKKSSRKMGCLIIFIIFIILGLIANFFGGKKGEKFNWNGLELSGMLPAPKSNIGEIISDSETRLSIYVHKTEREEFKAYRDECQSLGFTVESEKSENNYSAYNEAGYELSLWYDSSDKELHISLEAPMAMETLQWPTSEIGKLLPVPDSTVGKIIRESSDGFYIYVGNISKDNYNAYVNACAEKGFSVDYKKDDTYYRADNEDGYHVSLMYEGSNVMSVEIEKPKEPEATPTTAPALQQENTPTTDISPTPEIVNTVATSAPEPTPEAAPVLVDGMRPEFKAAMDSYEAFYVEYCDFYKKYSENPSDLGLLADYAVMMTKLADMNEKFDAWKDGDLNNAELVYYMEVNTRVTQKLLEVQP